MVAPKGNRRFRLAVAQAASRRNEIDANLETVLGAVEQAREQGAEHVLFPELMLSGYIADRTFSDTSLTLDSDELKRVRQASEGLTVTVGFIEETETSLFYNSAVTYSDGELIHLHRKVYLPTYGMFDERRYYGSGWDVSAFDTPQARVATLICGDAWHLPLAYMAAHQGADVLLILASSTHEGLLETTSCEGAWNRICQTYALTLSLFVVFANQANGDDDGLNHWGGSFVAKPDGNLLISSDTDGPDLVVADIDLNELRERRIRLPFRRDDSLQHTLELGRLTMARKLERDIVGIGPAAVPKPL